MLDKITLFSYINVCAELHVELQGTLNILAKATQPALAISSPLL